MAAGERGVVAEDFVFDDRSARPHGLEEVREVIGEVAVAGRSGVNLLLRFNVVLAWTRFGMLAIPVGDIFLALLFRPGADPPRFVGRPKLMELYERINSIRPAGVLATACRQRGPYATREVPAVIAVRINWQLVRDRPG